MHARPDSPAHSSDGENPTTCAPSRQERWRSELMADLVGELLSSEDEESSLRLLVARVAAFTSAAVVALVIREERELIVRAVGGAEAERARRMPAGTSLDDASWRHLHDSAEPGLMAYDDASARPCRADLGLAAHDPVAALPVSVGAERLGLLLVGWASPAEPVHGGLIGILEDLARQTGLALLAARAYRDRTRLALFEDRDRIARDMHDHVIQRLFATGLSLQAASRLSENDLVRSRIDGAVDELDEAIRHIRHTIFELHRPLPSGGIREQIHALVEGGTETLGFAPRLVIEGSLAGLSRSLEADLVAVVREALSNVARHAHADKGSVEIDVHDSVVVTVTDDGVGVDPGVAHGGLINLGSRAAGRSGRFEVRPIVPHGTRLRWEAPWEGRS